MNKAYLPKSEEGQLAHLAEEASELAGIINKTIRVKFENAIPLAEALEFYNPYDPKAIDNSELIRKEIADVKASIRKVENWLK